MIEGDRRFESFVANPGLRTQYQQEIYEGLALGETRLFDGEAGFVEMPCYLGGKIVSVIEGSFVELSRKLSIPIPEVGLTMGWDGKETFIHVHEKDRVEDIIANAHLGETHPSGIVRYSPIYLSSLVAWRWGLWQGGGVQQPLPLEAVTAHEGYHIWQFLHQQKQIKRDVLIYNREGSLSWVHTRSEREATEFQNKWVEEYYRPRAI